MEIQANESEWGELDWALTLSHACGKEEMARQLANVYLLESSDLLEKMRISIAAEDKVTLARASHTLKGASGYFGAMSVIALCKLLESQAKSGELTLAAETFALLSDAIHRLATSLRRKMSS
jgi:two-component system, sensor histidine kinase and response regulator